MCAHLRRSSRSASCIGVGRPRRRQPQEVGHMSRKSKFKRRSSEIKTTTHRPTTTQMPSPRKQSIKLCFASFSRPVGKLCGELSPVHLDTTQHRLRRAKECRERPQTCRLAARALAPRALRASQFRCGNPPGGSHPETATEAKDSGGPQWKEHNSARDFHESSPPLAHRLLSPP